MRRWGHAHSVTAGALVGLLISYRPWILFGLGVAVGIVLTLGWRIGRQLSLAVKRSIASRVHSTRRETQEPTPRISKEQKGSEGFPAIP